MHNKIHEEVVLCPEYSVVSNNINAVVFTAKYVVALNWLALDAPLFRAYLAVLLAAARASSDSAALLGLQRCT